MTLFDLAAWDKQIETDLSAGKLDALLAEADEDCGVGGPPETDCDKLVA